MLRALMHENRKPSRVVDGLAEKKGSGGRPCVVFRSPKEGLIDGIWLSHLIPGGT